MENWTLPLVISHFDDYLQKEVDFAHLPKRESEEYRQQVLRVANDIFFTNGRYDVVTEWILEMFDVPEVCALTSNLAEIDRLTAAERKRLGFYRDVKEVCYPLFRAQKVDWTAWPWQLTDGSNTLNNRQLCDMICRCEWPNVSAVILSGLQHQMFLNQEGVYSCVARQEASNCYHRTVAYYCDHALQPRDEEHKKKLIAAISECADGLWSIENHMLVGQLLGFDAFEQSIYDLFDTFIDSTYRYNQILCTRELAAWLRQNWTIGEEHPSQEKIDLLDAKWKEVMARYDVTTPDEDYSWNILALDVLGMSMFPEEDEDTWDDDMEGE